MTPSSSFPSASSTVTRKENSFPEGISAEVHLFSDGRFPDVPDFAVGNLNVHYHAAGKMVSETPAGKKEPVLKPDADSADNVAVVTFNALRDEQDPTKLRAFVRCLNFRAEPAATKVQLEVLVGGTIKGVYENPLKLDA